MVEDEDERSLGRPGFRLRGFRRPRPRPRFRPPGRLRPQQQGDEEERELEEMMAALGENSPLKAEFEKFMKEQLTGGTGPRRFRPTGTLNRSKLRGLISRTKLRKQLQQQVGINQVRRLFKSFQTFRRRRRRSCPSRRSKLP